MHSVSTRRRLRRLLDLGYVAFFALGVYTLGWFGSGFFSNRDIHFPGHELISLPGIHMSFWVVMILAGVVAGSPGSSLAGRLCACWDYLAIVTLGFGEIIPDIFRNGDQMPLPEGVQGSAFLRRVRRLQPRTESVESRSSIALGSGDAG